MKDELTAHGFVVMDREAVPEIAGRWGSPQAIVSRERDDSWSLSGTYGLEAFPWHTDGAISSRPPRWIVLRALSIPQSTYTELLDPDPPLLTGLRRTVLRAVDRTGRARHLPAAVSEEGRWRVRWDPRTCDPRIGLSLDEVEAQDATTIIEWREGRIVVLDNARLLHRRPTVPAGRVLERTYVWSE
ncbi:hypothetical protein [Streptosporangium sp. OZ121]|uniref:hypothetical protein n=1 Tax=Streptosporangium sp. OZ121 TaxID=3444183 RepID=UPI003F7AD235